MNETLEHIRALQLLKADGKPFTLKESTEDLLVRHGLEFPNKLNLKPYGEMKMCFKNAAELAFDDPSLVYCEGYACSIIPVHHAWCVDRKGRVHDITWKDGHSYFGIPFQTRFVRQRVLKTKNWGLLYCWWQREPLELELITLPTEHWRETITP